MNVIEILNDLKELGIAISKEGSDLKIKAPQGAMTERLYDEIKHNKEALLGLLSEQRSVRPVLEPIAKQADYPVSPQQYAIWVLSQSEAGSIAYNMPLMLKWKNAVNREALEKACRTIVAQHEALRTCFFRNEEGELRQKITDAAPQLKMIRHPNLSKKTLDQFINEEGMTPFDLERAPLVRFTLLQSEDETAYLLITLHHLICDGLSLQILKEQLLTAYRTVEQGLEPSVELPSFTYPDYVAWLQRNEAAQTWKKQLDFWKKNLEGELPVIQLASRSRPPVKTFNGMHLSFKLAPEHLYKLEAICRSAGTTLFTGLMSGMKLLIQKYSGETDIMVGTAVSGRNHPDLQSMVGLFINPLPVRTQIDTSRSFREHLQFQQQVLDEVLEHQEVPFAQIADQVDRRQDFSRSPLFDWMLIYNDWRSASSNKAPNTDPQVIRKDLRKTSQYDQVISFNYHPEEHLSIDVEFNTDIYPATFVKRFFYHFENLLAALVQHSTLPVEQVSFITDSERSRIINEFNDTAVHYDQPGSHLGDLFRQQVAAHGTRTALRFKDQSYSFRELDQLSDQMAHFLSETFDSGPETIIGVELPKSEWMIISILGILKTGSAYLPVSPFYPQARKDYIAQDSRMAGCIDEALIRTFRSQKDHYASRTFPLPEGRSGQDLAYVIYTSGSTGNPKGCMLEHEGVINRIEWMWRDFQYNEQDVILQKTTFTFDVSVWEILMPLCWGCQMVLCEEEDIKVPQRITELIRRHRVSCLHFVPSMLDAYIRDQFADSENMAALASLKRVITSGEALSASSVRNWYAKLEVPIFNLYGPTEASIDVTYFDTRRSFDGPVPIGKPVANTQVYIFDRQGNLLPPGVKGEIYLGGVQLARGYLNKEALSRERFVDNPLREGQTLYRTGDIGRWLEDGNIEYIERLDHQIKIRGYRVELGEIEHQITELESVSAAVAKVWEGPQGNQHLVAYFIGDESINVPQLKSKLRDKLPDYMVPTYFVPMTAFPLTTSGKADRKQLPDPVPGTPEADTPFEAPETPAEERVATVFQSVTGAECISRQTSFFAIGGDSISIIELANQLREQFETNLSIGDLYKHTTVEAIAHHLSQKSSGTDKPGLERALEKEWDSLLQKVRNTLPQGERIEAVYPMSDIQKGMVFGSMESEKAAVYHDQFVYPLSLADFEPDRFRRAFALLTDKHEILRTSFSFADFGTELQIVHRDVSVKIPFRDLRSLDAAEQRQVMEDYLKEERSRPFDFSNAPLWRVQLFQCSQDRIFYVLQFHHAILDGWSIASLNRELYELYATLKEQPNFVPAPLRCNPKAAAAAFTRERENQENLQFWDHYLSGYKRLDIFTDGEQPVVLHRHYDEARLDQLSNLAEREQTSVKHLFFAAFAMALQSLNREDELTLGMVGNNRPLIEDADQLLGCFLNTLPVRIGFPEANFSWRDFYQSVEENISGLKPYGQTTLYEIKNAFGDHSSHGNPFFDVLFNYIDFRVYGEVTKNIAEPTKEEEVVASHELTNSALVMDVNTTGGTLQLTYTLARPFASGIGLQALHRRVERALQCFLQDQEKPASINELLPAEAKKQILQSFSPSASKASFAGRTVLDLFRRNVDEQPDAVALETAEEQLTYRELDRRSGLIAHYLREKGIGSEDIVPICLQRSLALPIAILGVLKSGAAYLPIDPKYPRKRILHLLDQSRASLVITHSRLKHLMVDNGLREILRIDRFAYRDVAGTDAPPRYPVREDATAYLIYTSGSTGQPKGIRISHAALNNYINFAAQTYLSDTTGKGMGLYSSIAFDLTVTSIFCPLVSGKTLYIFPEDMEIDEVLKAYFDPAVGLEVIKLTPSHINLLPALDIRTTSIRKAIVGGEQLQRQHLEILGRLNPEMLIYNEYGPTESTVGCIVAELRPSDQQIHIGRPIVNTSAYILNHRMGLSSVGVIGELYLGGTQLARDYHHNPEETAKRFLPHPYGSTGNERLYRTGDLVKWLPDGNMAYIGRADDQVKIRGHRVEPGEIEKVFSQLESIEQVAVTVIDRNEHKELAGYFTSSTDLQVEELRQDLKERLPNYMVPAYLIQVPSFPLTINGKIDRERLPDVHSAGLQPGTRFIAPVTVEERMLAAAFQEVLHAETVGTKANFFNLGGDSIKAILLINQLKKYGYEIKVADVMQYPVLEELLTRLRRRGTSIPQETVTGAVELSPIQHWFFEHFSQPDHYHQSIMLSSTETIEAQRLDRALELLCDHHDALRLRFQRENGIWKQINTGTDGRHFTLQTVDLRQSDGWRSEQNAVIAALSETFDIAEGPMLQAVLFRLKTRSRLFLVAHHLVMDGLSWRILLEDLGTLYRQLAYGSASLPAKTHAYRDWSEALTAYAEQTSLEKELNYWKLVERNAGQITMIEPDRQVEERIIRHQAGLSFELDAIQTEKLLKRANRAYRTEINDVLLTALGLAVKRVFSQEALLVWLEGHGREPVGDDLDISRTIGWFTSIFPICLHGANHQHTTDFLIEVKDTLRRIPHKGRNYGLLRYLHPESGLELSQPGISFNFLGDLDGTVGQRDQQPLFRLVSDYQPHDISPDNRQPAQLSVTGLIRNGSLWINIDYNKREFRRATVQQLTEAYQSELTELITTLAQRQTTQLTPTDLTYPDLTPADLQRLSTAGAIQDVYGLSPLQEGMYFHWMLQQRASVYVEQTAYSIAGDLSEDHLRAGYRFLVDRHPILRTWFSHDFGDRHLQIVLQEVEPDFSFVDARQEPDREKFVSGFKEEARKTGFDLNAGPPIKLAAVRTDAERFELIWTYHHILMDGWCAAILIREFAEIYRAVSRSTEPKLEPVRNYVDYINWLAELDKTQSPTYWHNRLQGFDTVTTVPFKKARTGRTDYLSGEELLMIDQQTVSGLEAVCRKLNITEHTFLQAAWAFLLGKYNRTGDVVFGDVVSGRPAGLSGVESMIGLFINMIPARIRYDGRETVASFLQQVQKAFVDSLPHHYLQLSEVQAQSELKQELFDHGFVYLNYPRDLARTETGAGRQAEDMEMLSIDLTSHPNYDFNIVIAPAGGELQVTFWYNGHCFDAADVQRIGHHFREVIKAFIGAVEIPLSDIEYLPEAERRELLSAFNRTARSYPEEATVLDQWEKQLAHRPDALALVGAEESLTYSELDMRANQLAHGLIERGVQPGDFVPICLERSAGLVLSMLAVVKAGGVYVPIDPAYPVERITYIRQNSGCDLMISTETLRDRFTTVDPDHLLLLEQARIDRYSQTMPTVDPVIKPTDPFYMIYTSGSTGQPKGVVVAHRSLINLIDWHIERYEVTPGSRSTAMAGVGFDAAALETWSALLSGSTLYLVNNEIRLDPFRLLNFYEHHRITHAFVPPALIPALVAAPQPENLALQYILIGGDRLPGLDTSKISYTLVNQYGPTEATVMVTDYPLPRQTATEQMPPIGKPIANTALYVLDEQLHLVPRGIAGELYLAGVPLAIGYHNKPEETAERFVNNPYDSTEHTLLYRTGDLVRRLPDGNLEYLGRMDKQIQIRGHRVELGEVEQALHRIEAVTNAVVSVAEKDGHQQMAAYFTSDAELSVSALRSELKAVLPDYMIPAFLIQMDQLPLTANGKVDRRRLPDPYEMGMVREAAYQAPATSEEKALAEIYQDILGWEQVGAADNFFDLGGDSIKAILIINRLKQRGYTVDTDKVLQYPVIAELAPFVQALEPATASSPKVVEGAVPLSPIQRWFFEQIPHRNQFNQSVLLTSSEPVDVSILGSCLELLLQHHETLRIRFRPEGNTWTAYYAEAADHPPAPVLVDLRETEDWQADYQKACEDLQAGLDIEHGPLVQMALFRLPEEDRVLFIVHHLLVDGVSWRLLLEDFAHAYEQLAMGHTPQLPPTGSSYQEWTTAQLAELKQSDLQPDLAYWQAVHEAAKGLASLPVERKVEERLLKNRRSLEFALEPGLSQQLTGGANRAYRTEVNDLLVAGLGYALRSTFGRNQVLIRLEGHGRESINKEIDVNRTLGWFTSFYPLLLPDADQHSIEDYVVGIKEQLRKVPHQGRTYNLLRYELPDSGLEQLEPAVNFNFLGDFDASARGMATAGRFQLSEDKRGSEVHPENPEECPLTVVGWMLEGRLKISISYDEREFAAADVRKFADQYQQQLEQISRHFAATKIIRLTPSDLTFKQLTYGELEKLARLGQVEDVYPMSPLQEGIFYHWMSNPAGSVYVNQTAYTVSAELTASLIRESYRQLAKNHAVLRSCFTQEYGEEQLQIVFKDHFPQYQYLDARDCEDPAALLEDHKRSDREQGFDLGQAPPMKLKVIRMADRRYEFIWTHHHILMDGWCASLLLNEFYLIYQALANGTPLPKPKPYDYVDYIRWLDARDESSSLLYWDNYLQDYDTVATVPYLEERSETQTHEPRVSTLRIDGREAKDFQLTCRKAGVTPSHFVQACWAYLLSTYNHRDDVAFGTVVSGRPGSLPGVEEMIGLFINTIPVRARCTGKLSVSDFLQQLKQNAIEGVPHHYVKLSDIQTRSALKGELFDHIMVFENYYVQDKAAVAAAGDASPMEIQSIDTTVEENYDFVIVVIPEKDALVVNFKYNGSRMNETGVNRIKGHFHQLFRSFTAAMSSDVPVSLSSLSGLTVDEQQCVLEQFSRNSNQEGIHQTILDMLAAQSAQRPDQPALTFKTQTLTYRELEEQSNRCAHYLLDHEVFESELIPVCMNRSIDLLIVLLGILKAGKGYVPIDRHYPKDRIEYILKDTEASVCIVDSDLPPEQRSAWSEIGRLVTIESGELSDLPVSQPSVELLPESTAYVIYTSGSTGRPKGVAISHRSLSSYLQWARRDYLEDGPQKMGLFSPLAFDFTITSLWGTLISGGLLHIYPSDLDIADIFRHYFDPENGFTTIKITPAHVQLIEALEIAGTGIGQAILGGEQLHAAHIATLLRLNPAMQVINEYGPTEATVGVTTARFTGKVPDIVHIGRPIDRAEILLLDHHRRPVPVGIKGELYIGGRQLATGYYRNEALTNAAFVEHPFTPGEKLYKTGDLACWLEDGNLLYLGRKDAQVKIRGFRIEPGEVERVMMEYEPVRNAHVRIEQPEGADPFLLAYAVLDETSDAAALQSFLRTKLPPYMVPDQYMIMDDFPMTPNGKIDHKKLAEHVPEATSSTEPVSELERELCELWQEVLRLEELPGIHDNFFELGGHSIKAIKLLTKVHKRYEVVIGVDMMFKLTTIAKLAAHIENVNWFDSGAEATDDELVGIEI